MRIRQRLREESGLTLTELLITLMILGLVMGFVTAGLIAVQNTVMGETNRLENLGEARTLMNVMSKDIRTATVLSAGTSPFELAGPTQMDFYANLNTITLPNKVRISIDTTIPSEPVLREEVTPAAAGCNPLTPACYVGQPTDVRLVGKFVTNTAADPLFTYYDVNGSTVGTPGQALTAQEALQVRQVGISLSVRKSTSLAVPSTDLVNRVRLPNLYYTVPAP